jgi:SAM-dependent methyltransferase
MEDPISRDEQRMWNQQWAHYQPEMDVERPLLERWLRPVTLADLRGLEVLDAGCGNGNHTAILALAGAKRVRGVDYASWREAAARFGHLSNVEFGFHDLTAGPPEGRYDLVTCIGVLPHVEDPRRGVLHLAAAVKPGGRLLIWATVREGNTGLMVFDTAKKALTTAGGPRAKGLVAKALALASRPAQLAAARLGPVRAALPYGRYLAGLAALPLARVEQNFYDALNAPRRILFREHEVTAWMREAGLEVEAHVCEDAKSRTWIGRRPAAGG